MILTTRTNSMEIFLQLIIFFGIGVLFFEEALPRISKMWEKNK